MSHENPKSDQVVVVVVSIEQLQGGNKSLILELSRHRAGLNKERIEGTQQSTPSKHVALLMETKEIQKHLIE